MMKKNKIINFYLFFNEKIMQYYFLYIPKIGDWGLGTVFLIY